jgi:glycosyltransferase involved in cell wall biosynthesis
MFTIVSLAWNGAELTDGFLYRLKKYTDVPHKLVFSDNGSTEPIEGIVKEYYPDATFIRYEENIGCPLTRNPSMEKVDTDIVFWLDNDTYVGEGWYKPYLELLEKEPDVAMTGPVGLRVANPFSIGKPWKTQEEFTGDWCDWFVGYAIAFRKEFYRPIPDWNLKVNMDDVDVGIGVKIKGGMCKILPVKPNLEHLCSKTSLSVRPTGEQNLKVMEKWWEYWGVDKDFFEEYK